MGTEPQGYPQILKALGCVCTGSRSLCFMKGDEQEEKVLFVPATYLEPNDFGI